MSKSYFRKQVTSTARGIAKDYSDTVLKILGIVLVIVIVFFISIGVYAQLQEEDKYSDVDRSKTAELFCSADIRNAVLEKYPDASNIRIDKVVKRGGSQVYYIYGSFRYSKGRYRNLDGKTETTIYYKDGEFRYGEIVVKGELVETLF